MKNNMGGAGFHMIQVIIFSVFLLTFSLNTHILVGGSSMNVAQNSVEPVAQMLDLMEYNGVKKVSGEDEIEERRAQVLDKFRILLGLKSFNIRKPKNGDFENEFLAPSPAPSFENHASAQAPAPAPATVAHTRVPLHPSMAQSRPIPLQPEIQRSHGDQNRVRRIVIAIAVSGGVAFVVCALGFTLLCQKFRRGRKKRFARTTSAPGTDIRFRRSKCVNSPNSVSKKLSFDLGPEHFFLNTLEPVTESNASHLNYTCESLETLSKQNQTDPSLDLGIESGSEPIKYDDCSLEEEIVSAHEAEEPNNSESDGSNGSSLGNRIVPVESLSSDDESFHSFCDSHSSNLRISDVSKEDLNDPSAIFSPISCSNLSPSDRSYTHPCQSSSMKLPSLIMEPDPRTATNSNLSPPSPNESLTTSSQSSSITTKHVPPPPPPPPTLNFLPPLYSSHSPRVKQKSSLSSTMSNVSSSPRNSYSSTGSNTTPSNDFPSPPLLEPQPAAATNPATGARIIPPPPSPPLPPVLPPPFIKGNTKNLQLPPPAPGLFSQQNLVGKDGTPLPKLKPLHWDKVRATPDRSMVWDKLKSSSFEFDEKMIESLFGYNLQIKNDEAKSKSPSPSKHILEPKRLQNITILSKALNAVPEQVCDALIQGDGLCLQQLEALVKMVPTKEEEAKLSNYGGDVSELSSAEKFVKAILNIPFAFPRIEAMLYRDTFEDEVIHLRRSFAMLEEACKELRWSQLFLKLLEAVLKTGNRMNVGTIRGGARAFKLDALLKLADVKGTDGKTTLLHFVVQEMIRLEGIREAESITESKNQKANKTVKEREEDYRKIGLDLVSGLSTELCNVKKTATIDLDVLASSVSNLSDGMAKLKHLVDEDLSMDGGTGNFVNSMRSFLSYAEKNIKELKKDEDRVLLHVREITEYFHGDVSKDEANPLRIFVIVRDFLGMLDQVCKELRASKTSNLPIQVSPFR